MVSGRSEALVDCSRCGKPWIELELGDRAKRICTMCLSADEVQQLSLLSRRLQQKLKPIKRRKTPEARNLSPVVVDPASEQLALLPELAPQKKEIAPPRMQQVQEYRHLVICEGCNKQIDPTIKPWFAAQCQDCWPRGEVSNYYYKRWLEYNKR